MAGGRGGGGRGGDGLSDVGVGPVKPVGDAVIDVLRLGRRVEVLHGAEVFGGDRLEGRRPETRLERRRGEQRQRRTINHTKSPNQIHP